MVSAVAHNRGPQMSLKAGSFFFKPRQTKTLYIVRCSVRLKLYSIHKDSTSRDKSQSNLRQIHFTCKGGCSWHDHDSFLISKGHRPLSRVLLPAVCKACFSVFPPHSHTFFVFLWLHSLALSVKQLQLPWNTNLAIFNVNLFSSF